MRYGTIPDNKEKRAMNLHEYQSKRLFAEYGIPVPRGVPVKSPNAAVDAAKELGGELLDPIKTTNVQGLRCMTTWVVRTPEPA